MSRVITFSRSYPATHPKKGTDTFFVEKIWMSLIDEVLISMSKCCELSRETGIGNLNMYSLRKCEHRPKLHTIRRDTVKKDGTVVKRWAVGDMFSPRVWSGTPYRSKMITIAPEIEIVRIWNFEIKIVSDGFTHPRLFLDGKWIGPNTITNIAANDGLTVDDFQDWLMPGEWLKEFSGQILCWSMALDYPLELVPPPPEPWTYR